ncbi:hypothetical protein [Halomarina litorea]|uniref:hypothetical protein n=1 Tax=Halomarina litorea TaxID=2961595 RepID=UPI0020C1DA9D|nr:hypothetical protein [Halomarina sp. BCD28]
MDKRRLGYNLLLVGLAFVALAHTALSFVFETGLATVGGAVAILALVGLVVVNL